MGYFLLSFLGWILTSSAWAGSCCGTTPSSFPVLSGPQRMQLTGSLSLVGTKGRVFQNDDFYVWDDKDREVRSLALNLSSAFADRHQVFIQSALLRGMYSNARGTDYSQHFSDTQLGYTFEALPEYTFSYWRPVVYLSVLGNLPTGRSIYDSGTLTEGAGVTGHNQWGAGVALTLQKVFFPLTIIVQGKVLRVFGRDFAKTSVSDFYDTSLALLMRYALPWGGMAITGGLIDKGLSPREVGTSGVRSGPMKSLSLQIGLQRLFGEAWTGGVFVADETLLGRPRNTVLNRTYSLNVQWNYF